MGYDENGHGVNGTLGDEFNVPADISRDASTSLLMSGFAEPVDEFAKAELYVPEDTSYQARHKKLKLREEVSPIEMIRITSGGDRSSKKSFFLGNNDDGVRLNGSVGDVFKVPSEMDEELARKLIKKGYAEKKK